MAGKAVVDALAQGSPPEQESKWQKIAKYLINDSIPAQAVKSAWSGFTFPGDVLAGKADPYDYGRALDFAGGVTLGSAAIPAKAGEMRMGAGITKRGLADRIEEFGRGLGADLSVSEKSNGSLILNKIVVPKEMRGAGIGTQVMKRMIDEADNDGRMIALSPSADFGGNKSRLVEFYKRFGFNQNKGRTSDLSISETMVRQPTKRQP